MALYLRILLRYIDSVLESGSQLCLPTPVYYSDSDNLFRIGESGRTGKARIKQLQQNGGETRSPLVEEPFAWTAFTFRARADGCNS